MATHSRILTWRIPMDTGAWQATVHWVTKWPTDTTDRLSPYFTFWGLEWYYHSLKRIRICFYNANKDLWILALRPTRHQDASKLSFNPCESLSISSSFVSSSYSVAFRVSNKCLGYLPRTGYQLKGGKKSPEWNNPKIKLTSLGFFLPNLCKPSLNY